MSNHDFGPLTAQYPAAIASMAPEFRAHELILRLAQQNQPAPFLIVHRMLAKRLNDFHHLVKYQRSVPSTDIFGNQSECSLWKKL